MKAIIREGSDLLFLPNGNFRYIYEGKLILNFNDKMTYKSFKVKKKRLIVSTTKGDVVIVFSSGNFPTIEFQSYCKDQLVLKITNNGI